MRAAAAAALLAGPTALAFATGGYPAQPRLWAGLAAWLVVAAGLLAGGSLRGRAARLAAGGAIEFAGWTLLSTAWAPVAGAAWAAGQLAAVYAGALLGAALVLGGERERRWIEPALAAGAVVVVGYGLSERLLPGLLTFTRSVTADGRLEQPVTYWNGMGAVAALGLVLAARLAGDRGRAPWLRSAAVAACAPLGLGLALTVSRGALFAAAAGMLTLVVTAPRREQLLAVALAVATGGIAALAGAPFAGVTVLAGDRATRETEGAVVLAALLVVMALAVVARHLLDARVAPGPVRLPRRAGAIALAVVVAGFGASLLAGSDAGGTLTPTAGRLVSLRSNRYEYWKVAGRAFADRPVQGAGAGGWAVRWRRERPFAEQARNAHSLYFETAAELGVVGLVLLGAAFAGVVLAARGGEPGLVAVAAVWAAHVALDWDWQLPAVTLPAVVASGALLARRRAAPPA